MGEKTSASTTIIRNAVTHNRKMADLGAGILMDFPEERRASTGTSLRTIFATGGTLSPVNGTTAPPKRLDNLKANNKPC